jgi:MFS family permease
MIYKKLMARNKGVGAPEFRIPLMVPGSIIIVIGLFWYGWTGQAHTHWILPNIGAFLFCFGTIMCMQAIQSYTIDAYPRYAASAISTLNVAKSLTGFGFPLFAPYMYKTLDYGWGNSILGFVSLAIGIIAPPVLWKYGARLRAKSTYASGD